MAQILVVLGIGADPGEHRGHRGGPAAIASGPGPWPGGVLRLRVWVLR